MEIWEYLLPVILAAACYLAHLAGKHVKESTKTGSNRSPEAQAAYAKQVSEFYTRKVK